MRLVLVSVCVGLLAPGDVATAAGPPASAAQRDPSRMDKPDPEEILRQVLVDILTNPDLKGAREFYGTPGAKRVVLATDSPVAWPRGWRPEVPGYDIRFRSSQNPVLDFVYWYVPGGHEVYSFLSQRTPRRLAVCLNTFNPDPGRAYNEQIGVSLFNIGGDANGGAGGSCFVYYTLTKQGPGKWAVEYAGSFDP